VVEFGVVVCHSRTDGVAEGDRPVRGVNTQWGSWDIRPGVPGPVAVSEVRAAAWRLNLLQRWVGVAELPGVDLDDCFGVQID